MKKTHVALQFFCILMASGCGTVVGNPGGKKKDPAAKDSQPDDAMGSNGDTANNEVPSESVSVNQGSVATIQPQDPSPGAIIFDVSQLPACLVDTPIVEAPTEETPSFPSAHFTIDTTITATDVKFYFYNSTSFFERNPLRPNEVGSYRIYALSYSLKKGCYIEVVISAEHISAKSKITYKLKDFVSAN